jgi:hypothetical protein
MGEDREEGVIENIFIGGGPYINQLVTINGAHLS